MAEPAHALAPPVEAADTYRGAFTRRLKTVPLFLLIASLGNAIAPLGLAAAVIFDVVGRRRFATVRFFLNLLLYLWIELGGLVAALALWMSRVTAGGRAAYVERNYRIQAWWGLALQGGTQWLHNVKMTMEGTEQLATGRFVLFARHVSTADVLLPIVAMSQKGLHRRYVLKAELLQDPCLDIVGHRFPNAFVRRNAKNPDAEIEAIAQLAEDLGPRDGVVIYPEGTRYTEKKRLKALERLKGMDSELFAIAQRFQHLLPPRLGGPMALLERDPEADAVFCAHTGYDGVVALQSLFSGAMLNRHLQVKFWRFSARDIPREARARAIWFYERWAEMDAWIQAHPPAFVSGELVPARLTHGK